MEYNGHDFLDQLLALTTDPWELPIPQQNHLYTNNVDDFLDTPFPKIPQTPYFDDFCSIPFDHQPPNCSTFGAPIFGDKEVVDDTPVLPLLLPNYQEDQYSSVLSFLGDSEAQEGCGVFDHLETHAAANAACKIESVEAGDQVQNVGMERKSKAKKIVGQPSKNLMAERRRRKRLNDRLSMLRSVVPKISKMDRTSILGDTIDYMKELLERIKKLQEEIQGDDHHLTIFKDVKPNDVLVRNSPKFDVERRDNDTRIEICCASRPGLLLSTVTTLEALGLEIQQCVISCFNDFGMQASCSEEIEQRENLSTEDIKLALVRNAGYGGRCL